jgi:DNA-binding CsgD family transcriptional regulator
VGHPRDDAPRRPVPEDRESGWTRRSGVDRRRGGTSRSEVDAATKLALWQWTLECLADAVLCLDSDGRLCDWSPGCDGVIRAYDCLSVRNGRLVASGAPENAQRLLRALRGVDSNSPRRVALLTEKGRLALRLTFIHVPLQLRYTRLGRSVTRVVLVDVPARQPDMVADFARDYYDLTGAETRVLKGLLAGRAPKEIAAELRIGVTTVRSHLSRIFQKTHTTSQRELLARLVS